MNPLLRTVCFRKNSYFNVLVNEWLEGVEILHTAFNTLGITAHV